MLLELWSAEAPELKQGAVGGLMPVRCREVGQRLPESLMSGFMMWTQREEPRESSPHVSVSLSSPRMVASESNLHVLFFAVVTDVAKIRRERADSVPPGRTQWDGTTSLPFQWKTTATVRAPSAGSVGRDSWCCESGRRNPGTGYFPTPGSHPHPSRLHRLSPLSWRIQSAHTYFI